MGSITQSVILHSTLPLDKEAQFLLLQIAKRRKR